MLEGLPSTRTFPARSAYRLLGVAPWKEYSTALTDPAAKFGSFGSMLSTLVVVVGAVTEAIEYDTDDPSAAVPAACQSTAKFRPFAIGSLVVTVTVLAGLLTTAVVRVGATRSSTTVYGL